MGILKEILDSVPKSNFDEKVKIICDKIMVEENLDVKNNIPNGPNIFLTVQIKTKQHSFLCLEREMKEKYILSLWIRLKRQEVWDIPVIESSSVEKLITFFAIKLKYLNGES